MKAGNMNFLVAFFCMNLSVQTSLGFEVSSRTRLNSRYSIALASGRADDEKEQVSRRSILATFASTTTAGFGLWTFPRYANAGIDVSGLRVEGGSGNPDLARQIKAYDGSGSARVREIKSIQSEGLNGSSKPVERAVDSEEEDRAAHWAYRANPSFSPSLSRAGAFGNLFRCNDQVAAPTGSKRRSIGVQFEFPADWLQLDKFNGGIQYVDQRNGDKLYVLMADLPPGTKLESVPKSVIGDLIFDPQGSVVKTGQTIEDYKVASAQILSQCPEGGCATRRRFKMKYATVTGNGLRVERRALVDAYEVENSIYMLMTSSNAVKFEQKDSIERETVESIVSSFQLDI